MLTVTAGAWKANLQLFEARQVDSLEAASVTTTSLLLESASTARPVLRIRQVIWVVVTVKMSQKVRATVTAWSVFSAEKFVPVIVKTVPPKTEPWVGVMSVTVEEVLKDTAEVSRIPY